MSLTTGDFRSVGLRLLAAMVVGGSPLAAAAAVEEVIVTTRKRAEDIQDIPLSISTFDSTTITRQGIQNLQDVARLTPGVVFDLGFGPQDTRISIRGLPANRGKPPVAILIDGIDVSSEAIATGGGGNIVNLRLMDAERIDVVKGPQSALFGRSAFGGAINYVTREPSDELNLAISGDFGNYGQQELRASAEGPVIDDRLAMRLNVAWAEHDGFYRNTITGDDLGGLESTGLALSAKFTPADNLTINGRVAYSDDEYGQRPLFVRGAGTATTSVIPVPPSANAGGVVTATSVTVASTDKIKRLGGPITFSVNPRTGSDYPGSTLESLISSVRVDWRASDNLRLQSWTGYNQADSTQFQDSDQVAARWTNVPLPAPGGIGEPLQRAQEYNTDETIEQVSQEFRLSNDDASRVRWAVGALWWQEDLDQDRRDTTTILTASGASAGLNTFLANQNVPPGSNSRNIDHWSVYGLLEVDFAERWTVGAEARYSEEDFDYAQTAAATIQGTGTTPIAVNPASLVSGSASSSAEFFAPRVFARYRASDATMIYGSVARGVKPGGFSTLSFFGNYAGKEYDDEKLTAYELGVRSEPFDRSVLLNATVFYQDYTDQQFTSREVDPLSPVGIANVVRNLGQTEIWGLELQSSWSPVDGLDLGLSYTWMDAEYTDFSYNSNSANAIARAGNCEAFLLAGSPTCRLSLTGNDVERVPRNALTGNVSYQGPLRGEIDWLGELTFTYQDERKVTNDNLWALDDYWRFDARLGVLADRWSLIAYAQNLLDDTTVTSAQESFDVFNFSTNMYVFAPARRQLGVRFAYSF